MSIPRSAREAAWTALAEAMDVNPDDRGMYELELIEGLDAALAAVADHIAAQAWDEGAEAQARAYGMDKDTGANPYRKAAND